MYIIVATATWRRRHSQRKRENESRIKLGVKIQQPASRPAVSRKSAHVHRSLRCSIVSLLRQHLITCGQRATPRAANESPEYHHREGRLRRGSGGWEPLYVPEVRRWRATFAESPPRSLSVSCAFNHKGNSERGRMRLPGWSFSHSTSPGGLLHTLPSLSYFWFYYVSLLCYTITWQIKTSWKLHFKGQSRHWLYWKSKIEVNGFAPKLFGMSHRS